MTHPRIAKGVAKLDAIRPNWREEIDLTKLDMSNLYNCVLGQLFHAFHHGCAELSLPYFDDQREHGFDTEGGMQEYMKLNGIWIREIDPDWFI